MKRSPIGIPTATPTLRWTFQLLYGISQLKITLVNKIDYVIDGISHLREKILRLFGDDDYISNFFWIVGTQCGLNQINLSFFNV